jgi:hypothetical protein
LRAVSRTVVVVLVVRAVVAVLWAAQPVNSKPASRAVVNPEQVANGRAERVIEASPWDDRKRWAASACRNGYRRTVDSRK